MNRAAQQKDATEKTQKINRENYSKLPFANTEDFDNATRGFLGTTEDLFIKTESGAPIWTLKGYEFLQNEESAATVHPSLWRQAQLNMHNGLYEVVKDGVYQIRSFDLSVMSIIEGPEGLVVIDPLVSVETAKAGLELYRQHRGDTPIVAVIYTHSHIDHYGGVKGAINEQDVIDGRVKIFAPQDFMKEVVSENVYAGNAMRRRSLYMYGQVLPRSAKGQVDAGLGKTVSLGTTSLIAPTDTVTKTGETHTIAGLEFVFQMAQQTEAPAEMLFYIPEYKAFCSAEDATHNMHNLYTLRGAQVRDAAQWWKVLNESIELFGDKLEVVFASHHWPTWGRDNAVHFMKVQRDMFKFLHDQTLRLANMGYTSTEIAEELRMPQSLQKEWSTHDYYGSLRHNAKAVYQRYLGWYDANPANLNPLPPTEAGKKYVEFMGGAEAVIANARKAFEAGEYRFVAEVLKHVVFADPQNTEAKELQADTFEQLGYQCENPTWRNEYLMGAHELRNGLPPPTAFSSVGETAGSLPTDMVLDYLGIRLNNERAEGKRATFNLHITDRNETFVLNLDNSTLTYTEKAAIPNADMTIHAPHIAFLGVAFGQANVDTLLAEGAIRVEGDQEMLKEFVGLLDTFELLFNIVTP